MTVLICLPSCAHPLQLDQLYSATDANDIIVMIIRSCFIALLPDVGAGFPSPNTHVQADCEKIVPYPQLMTILDIRYFDGSSGTAMRGHAYTAAATIAISSM